MISVAVDTAEFEPRFIGPESYAAAPNVNEVDDYARQVVFGHIPAGRYHRLSCARHLRDRLREGTTAFPYRFDIERARRFFRFAEKLKHYKGKQFAGKFIKLEPHQKFRLGSIFGWVTPTGRRRFRIAYNEIPRKNGKSLEAACVMLYVVFFDNEPGAEGYCIATKREQALLVFKDAAALVRSSGLRDKILVPRPESKSGRNMNRPDRLQKLEALGADHDSTDGLNPSAVCVDEMHAYKNRGLIDVMITAWGSREQPLCFEITTAGDDPVSPCGDEHEYAVNVLEQRFDDETFFAFIAHADATEYQVRSIDEDAAIHMARLCTCGVGRSSASDVETAFAVHADDCGVKFKRQTGENKFEFANSVENGAFVYTVPADDWLDERTFAKANPNYGVSIDPAGMLSDAQKASKTTGAAASFKQKKLNIWVSASAPWLSVDGWRAGQSKFGLEIASKRVAMSPVDESKLIPEFLKGRDAYAGVDLASKIDLCALVLVFPGKEPPNDIEMNEDERGVWFAKLTEQERKWYVLRWVWTPADTLKERARRDRAPYETWVERGFLLTHPGTSVHHVVIRDTLREIRESVNIVALGFDPWHAGTLIDDMKTFDGFADEQCLAVTQSYAGLSAASSRIEAEVLAGNVDAGGCPLMAWCASNAVTQRDGKDNIQPIKKRSRGRIDPIVAIANATSIALKMPTTGSVYERRGI